MTHYKKFQKSLSLLTVLLATFLGFAPLATQAAKLPVLNAPVDLLQSKLKWTGYKITGQHFGSLKVKSGTLDFSNGNLVGGSILVDMKSITVDDKAKDPDSQQKLVGHLANDDFFSNEKFPTAEFVIKKVTPLKKPSATANHSISGDLIIKGQSHPLTLDADLMKHGVLFHAAGKASVDRTLYGIKYKSAKFFSDIADKAINDNFDLEINIYAKIPK